MTTTMAQLTEIGRTTRESTRTVHRVSRDQADQFVDYALGDGFGAAGSPMRHPENPEMIARRATQAVAVAREAHSQTGRPRVLWALVDVTILYEHEYI